LIRGLSLAVLLIFAWVGQAAAHKPSDAYLRLSVGEGGVEGSLDLALRDLDLVVGVDGNGDGAVTWGELKARHAAIAAYVQSRLVLAGADGPCELRPVEHLVDRHTDGAYAVLRFAAECRGNAEELTLRYGLLFDVDPTHRGLVSVGGASGGVTAAVLSPEQPELRIDLAAEPSGGFRHFVVLGVEHIATGFDHLLFLLVLLLPAVYRRDAAGRWRPLESWRLAAVDIVKILTAFTLAHGASLTAAVTGLVDLPTRLVESAIAVTIVVTALDNVWPCLPAPRWLVAFGFGLIHGLGFASVLGPLDLPALDLAVALAGFNLGIEIGQVAVALLFLVVAYPLRTFAIYGRGVLPAGSAAAMALGGVWLLDRAFALDMAPF
jgi:HupE / UreJ protein